MTPTLPILRQLTPLILDFETKYTKEITLKKLSLRRYIAAAPITMLAIQFGSQSLVLLPDQIDQYLPVLKAAFESDNVVIVAHNSSFDIRVAVYKLGLPWPKHELCTLELAQAAFPNQPGGYGLDNLSNTIKGVPPKIEIDLREGRHTDDELKAYCMRDVQACDAIYRACLPRIGDEELRIAEMTARSRNLSLRIDQDKGRAALDIFTAQVEDYAHRAAKNLLITNEEDMAVAFGLDRGKIKSVKPAGIKKMLLDSFGFETDTISKKKLNPELLRRNPAAAAVIEDTSKANSTLSHVRRVGAFLNDTSVDLNLSYFGSHTGRWTCKGSGKGVNFLNLPKHDKLVAPLIRGMLSIEGDRALVRGDAMSLEYRMLCWLTGCTYGCKLFEDDHFADAYVAFGERATGLTCNKTDPIRQVWKTCVLGLGFLMYPRTHALNLAKMLAQQQAYAVISGKPADITLDHFKDFCSSNRWTTPNTNYYNRILRETGLDPAIVSVAHNTHALFHRIHPEFKRFSEWLEAAVMDLSRAPDPQNMLKVVHGRRNAPDIEKVELFVDDSIQGRSIKVRCGPWYQPTLTWRDVGVRRDAFGSMGLCSVKAGNRGYRKLTPNVLIENVVQAAGRNAIADGMLRLSPTYPYILNIHDEVLLAVPNTTKDVHDAYTFLDYMYGPDGSVSSRWDWTCIMNPAEINVSHSLWEEDVLKVHGADFWDRLANGDQALLDRVV